MSPESHGWNGNRLGPRAYLTYVFVVRAGAPVTAPALSAGLGIEYRQAQKRLNELGRHGLTFRPDGDGNGWVPTESGPDGHDPTSCRACGTPARVRKAESESPAPDPLSGVTTRETAPESVSVETSGDYGPDPDVCPDCGYPVCVCGLEGPTPPSVPMLDAVPGTDAVIGWQRFGPRMAARVYELSEVDPGVTDMIRPVVRSGRVNVMRAEVLTGGGDRFDSGPVDRFSDEVSWSEFWTSDEVEYSVIDMGGNDDEW